MAVFVQALASNRCVPRPITHCCSLTNLSPARPFACHTTSAATGPMLPMINSTRVCSCGAAASASFAPSLEISSTMQEMRCLPTFNSAGQFALRRRAANEDLLAGCRSCRMLPFHMLFSFMPSCAGGGPFCDGRNHSPGISCRDRSLVATIKP